MLGTDARPIFGRRSQSPYTVRSLVSAVLDAIYQLIAHRFIYPLELLFTATLLALVPYLILRGPVNRIASRFILPESAAERVDKNARQ